MKKATAFAVAGSALALLLSLALARPPDTARPDGVAANAWIPITANAGFVVTGINSQVIEFGGPAHSIRGYLMVRRKDMWVRLDPDASVRAMPTN